MEKKILVETSARHVHLTEEAIEILFGKGAKLTNKGPDLTVSVQAFGQMAAGCASLAEAKYRPDVTVSGNEETLAKVFIRKPILVEDHF